MCAEKFAAEAGLFKQSPTNAVNRVVDVCDDEVVREGLVGGALGVTRVELQPVYPREKLHIGHHRYLR